MVIVTLAGSRAVGSSSCGGIVDMVTSVSWSLVDRMVLGGGSAVMGRLSCWSLIWSIWWPWV
eukprot:10897671-Alexandrium_andersonii.AAC.1